MDWFNSDILRAQLLLLLLRQTNAYVVLEEQVFFLTKIYARYLQAVFIAGLSREHVRRSVKNVREENSYKKCDIYSDCLLYTSRCV